MDSHPYPVPTITKTKAGPLITNHFPWENNNAIMKKGLTQRQRSESIQRCWVFFQENLKNFCGKLKILRFKNCFFYRYIVYNL